MKGDLSKVLKALRVRVTVREASRKRLLLLIARTMMKEKRLKQVIPVQKMVKMPLSRLQKITCSIRLWKMLIMMTKRDVMTMMTSTTLSMIIGIAMMMRRRRMKLRNVMMPVVKMVSMNKVKAMLRRRRRMKKTILRQSQALLKLLLMR